MSNETDLDWLARNVHVWRDSGDDMIAGFIPGSQYYGPSCAEIVWCKGGITKRQWLARRAELQNKPSWNDAPEWVEWLAQDKSGFWYWYASKPTHPGMKSWWPEPATENSQCGKGEVLGDWRDTLERRPADLSEPAVAERLAEATQTVLAAAPALMDEKFRFDRDDWFERGELPPVGTVCLYVVSDRLSAEVEITAHAKLGLCFVEVGKSGENYVSKTAELHRFRPIPTERDKAIEAMGALCPYPGSWETTYRLFAEALYDAGYRAGGAA